MPNPLYNQLVGNAPIPLPGNAANILAQARQMAQSFNGDPRAEVQKLLSSGQMSQAQFNQLASMANQLMRFGKM